MKSFPSDVAFSPAVKAVQRGRGSRALYERVENGHGFATEVTGELRAFLAEVDTAFLATASADGQPYVQHRGGPPGFVRARADGTLAFVDFTGNRQYVSTGNLAENDRVCLLLMDYAHRRRVKVWGRAQVVPATAELLAELATPGYRGRAEQVVVVTVSAWDVNCPQHIPRKVDAEEAETERAARKQLEERVTTLERENARLRDLAATRG
jgi:predicted pyridoxine 5'-phosphate oxidase superfamily flavin-nucleotide-binding protein